MCFFVGALLHRIHELTANIESVADQLTTSWATLRFTIDLSFTTFIMFVGILGGVLLMSVLQVLELLAPAPDTVFRWELDNVPVEPPRLKSGQHHAFLSYVRATTSKASGQELARSIETQLTSLCPGLLVDNSRSRATSTMDRAASFGSLANGMQAVVAILTGTQHNGREQSDYFRSKPCQQELARAQADDVPVVFVLETDPQHGGISLEAHRHECAVHCPQLLPFLDGSKVVEWHRVRAYQDISLKLVLQEVLQRLAAQRFDDVVYLRREITREPVRLRPPPKGSFHFYVSKHNLGADTLVGLLAGFYEEAAAKRRRLRRGSTEAGLTITTDPTQMLQATHFFCYLNELTHTSGQTSAVFHAELEFALRQNMHILLVHEMRPEADGWPFKAIVDSTPDILKWEAGKRAKRLYNKPPIMLCGSQATSIAHLYASLHVLLSAIAARPAQPLHELPSGSSITAELEVIRAVHFHSPASGSYGLSSSEKSELASTDDFFCPRGCAYKERAPSMRVATPTVLSPAGAETSATHGQMLGFLRGLAARGESSPARHDELPKGMELPRPARRSQRTSQRATLPDRALASKGTRASRAEAREARMEVRAARTAKKKARNEARAEAAREAQKLRRKTALDAVMAEFGRGKSAQDLVVEAQTLNKAFDVATISTADGSSASSPQASPEPNTVSGGQLEWDPVHKSWRMRGPASGASTSSPSPLDAATWALKRASAGPRVETSTVIGSSQEVTAQPQQAASRPRLEWDAVHGAWKLAGGAGAVDMSQPTASDDVGHCRV